MVAAMAEGEKGPGTSFTDISITYRVDVSTTYRVSTQRLAISCSAIQIVFTDI